MGVVFLTIGTEFGGEQARKQQEQNNMTDLTCAPVSAWIKHDHPHVGKCEI